MGKGDTIKIDAVAIVRSATAPANNNVLWWDTAAGGNTLNNKLKVFSSQSGKWETLDGTSKTGADLLEEIKKIDGSGSGIDADLLDGFHASAFVKTADGFIRQTGAEIYGAAQGTDTYTVTLAPTLSSYKVGMSFNIKFANSNTGAATLNVDGQGAKAIVKKDGTALTSGDIPAGSINNVVYDGTSFQLGAAVASVIGSSTLQDVITAGGTYSGPATVSITSTSGSDSNAWSLSPTTYSHTITDGTNTTTVAIGDDVYRVTSLIDATGVGGTLRADIIQTIVRHDGAGSTLQDIMLNGTQMLITDTINTKGLEYAADYSGAFTNESLITKRYVDSAVSGIAPTLQQVVDNGSTYSGTTTVVSFDHNDTSKRTQFAWNNQNWDVKVSDVGTGANGRVSLSDTATTILWSDGTNDKALNFNATDITLTDTVSSKGIVYGADYSSNFVARSLIDKGYADATYAPIATVSSQWTTNGSDIYYNTGNVGIGETTPTAKLHLKDTSAAVNLLIESTTTENAVLTLRHSATGGASDENSVIVFQEDTTTHWTIGLNGKNGAAIDEFVFANGTSLDANPVIVIDKAGATGFMLGVGVQATNILEVGGATTSMASMLIKPQTGTPSTPASGMLRNDAGALTWYDGSAWVDLTAGGGGGAVTNDANNNLYGGTSTGGSLAGADKRNTLLGYQAGRNMTTAAYNVVIGDRSVGDGVATGNANVAIGSVSMKTLTSGTQNVAIGTETGKGITTQSNNVLIGFHAGDGLTGSNNIAITNSYGGYQMANRNAFVGEGSGTAVIGSKNAILGKCNTNMGDGNIALGHNIQQSGNVTGNGNIFIHPSHAATSNYNAVSGDDNCVIGLDVEVPTALSDYVSLYDLYRGDHVAGEAYIACPATAAVDGDLNNNELHFSVDEAGNTLDIKVKYSTGTVKTISGLALT